MGPDPKPRLQEGKGVVEYVGKKTTSEQRPLAAHKVVKRRLVVYISRDRSALDSVWRWYFWAIWLWCRFHERLPRVRCAVRCPLSCSVDRGRVEHELGTLGFGALSVHDPVPPQVTVGEATP